MTEIKERTLKVLQALSQMTEPVKPGQIGEAIGEKPIDVGRHLGELLKAGFAEKTDKTKNLWAVTGDGAEYMANVEEKSVSQPHVTGPVTGPSVRETATVPSQSDLLLVVSLRVGGVDVQLPGIHWYEWYCQLE